jgi:hypothetical protein
MTQENYADRVLRYVCAVIAHPHVTITEHDKHRALEIMRYLFPDADVVEYLYSQMNQEDFKQVKNIREHARNAIK